MNAREKYRIIANGGRVDQMPCFEEELREDVLAAWRAQGMPAWVTGSESRRFFRLDRIESIPVRFGPGA